MFDCSLFAYYHDVDPRIMNFLKLCNHDGYDARLVGGYLRDLIALKNHIILNHPVSSHYKHNHMIDVDVAINIPPQQVLDFCARHKFRVIPTGIDHGTVTVFIDDQFMVEVTSLRSDVSTNGRHAIVAFGASFEQDALRRDFTMNALYMDYQGILYDAFHGVDDIKNRRVRFIGLPHDRIREDALRLWRYFRFLNYFSMPVCDANRAKIDERLPPIEEFKDTLSQLSIERVQKELFKIIDTHSPIVILEKIKEYGLFKLLLGHDTIDISSLQRLLALALTDDIYKSYTPCVMTRMVVFCAGLNRENLPFKFTREEQIKYNTLSTFMQTMHHGKIMDAFHDAIYSYPEYWHDVCALALTFDHGIPFKWDKVIPTFPITGTDLLKMGIAAGPEMGHVLRLTWNQWFNSKFSLSHERCVEIALGLWKMH